MYLIFLLNAFILAYLGVHIFRRDESALARIFLAISFSFAVWDICVVLLQLAPGMLDPNWVTKIQNQMSVIFFNGFYYFSRSYPHPRSRRKYDLNLIPLTLLSIMILFTDSVTRVTLVNGVLQYQDGLGWTLYTVYVVSLITLSTVNLIGTYRNFPGYRSRVKVLLTGIVIFVGITMVFNTILPAFGIQGFIDLGYISISFPPYFIAYALTKQDLLDVDFLINRTSSWLITLLFVAASFGLADYYTRGNFYVNLGAMIFLGGFWAFFAQRLQTFMLTSAKRKFVRGWYDPEEVLTLISSRITAEQSRAQIFTHVIRALDKVFEVERYHILLASRGENEELEEYHLLEGERGRLLDRISPGDTLIKDLWQPPSPVAYLEECKAGVRDYLEKLGYPVSRGSMIVVLNSPEMLEGVLLLGERSNGYQYSEQDKRFCVRLVNYMTGVFYRLTPFEKLEKIYFENKQKLHEAEIQLMRAQKIKSIVHATRQCHHEIRTPLNIIRLGIGRIHSMEDLESYKRIASEEISRALEIVDETLTITDVSKASDDRYSSFSVNEVLSRCARLVDDSRYELELDLDEVPLVWGSFSDLQVVITNLIHNATDAMDKGGRLSLHSRASHGNVIIEVADSGPGIPESLRASVWDPYVSGHQTEVGNSTAGRGWGLTIVNRIVTEHHGTINFVSDEGVGTRFTIALPARDAGAGNLDNETAGDAGKVVDLGSRRAKSL